MYRSLSVATFLLLVACVGDSASAQTPAGVSQRRDTVTTSAVVNARVLSATHARDSVTIKKVDVGDVVMGSVAGGLVGAAVGARSASRCSGCAYTESRFETHALAGAAIGAVATGSLVWIWESTRRSPVDSAHSAFRSALYAASGAVVGAAVGFAIEYRANPAPSCSDCGVDGGKRNAAFAHGAELGGVVGGVAAWFFFGRK